MQVLFWLMFVEMFLVFTLFYCLSLKHIWLIDLTSPVVVVVMVITNLIALFKFFPETEASDRYISNASLMFYPVFLLFCDSDYHTDLAIRMVYLAFSRVAVYDKVPLYAMTFFVILIAELPFYYRSHETLKLFVLQRQSAIREKQLEGVLDMLPGGVVILKKDNNECVFKNKSADEMFKSKREVKSNDAVPRTSKLREIVDPFKAKIFELKDSISRKLSFIDISDKFEQMTASNEPEKTIECTMLTKRRF